MRINSRFFRRRRRSREEQAFLKTHCLCLATLSDMFELQNEILVRLQKQGMQV